MREPEAAPAQGETLDDLILGDLKLIQPVQGYRFSLDAILLAHFPVMDEVKQAVDLGTGNGVIPMLLALRTPQARIVGVELQSGMVERARRSVALNGLQDRIEIIEADVREIDKILPGGSVELVLSNPPFFQKGEGHVSRHAEQAIARHELQMNLQQLISQASFLLAPGGRLALIHRAERLAEILENIHNSRLNPTRLRTVHAFLDREAGLVLLEAVKSRRSRLKVLPPLIIYTRPGQYSSEIQAIYGEK